MGEQEADTNERPDDAVSLTIDGKSYRVAREPVTGMILRQLPSPPIGADLDLVLMSADGDLLVRDDEVLELREGLAFFAVPRRILAGR